jgi:hypothetical protein
MQISHIYLCFLNVLNELFVSSDRDSTELALDQNIGQIRFNLDL